MSVARVNRTASPYNAGELAELDYVQSFDVVYLAHLNHDPGKLIRASHTNWAFSSLTFGPTIAAPTAIGISVSNPNVDAANSGNAYFPQADTYAVTAVDDQSGQESRASSTVSGTNDLTLKRNKNTISFTPPAGAERCRIYKSHNQQDFGWIGDTDQTSFTDDNIDPDLTDAPPQAFDPFTLSGNPSTVCFMEQRLIWARTATVPNGVFGSRSADFENMDSSRPTRADDSIVFRIAAQKVNSVNALVPVDRLLALTGDAVFKIVGSNDDFLSANPPPRALRQSGRGANRLKPLVVDEVVFYQPSIGSEVRTLGYAFDIDGYKSNDVSIFSPGFFKGFSLNSWSYAEEPMSVIWAVRSDGKMPAFTWQQEQQVWGWTICETDGEILDVATIKEGGESRTYLLVRRTIAGAERVFVERLASAKWEDQLEACYLDCALTFFPAAPQQEFVVAHLKGMTVDALADGFVVRGITVGDDGVVDVGFAAEQCVTIGLPYAALIETLPLGFDTPTGSPADKRQMFVDVAVQVVDTRMDGLEVGRRLLSTGGANKLYPFKARNDEPLGDAMALFTGLRHASTEPVVSGEATLILRHADPTPFTLSAAYLDPIIGGD
jgi:hypothetical protein